MTTAGNKTDIIKYKHPDNNYTMNTLTIHRTTKYPFFKKETVALQAAGTNQPEALPVQTYSCDAANTLLNNVRPNQRKLSRRLC
ncbi:hypothetical protein, partial [Bacteroides faecichinchillae]|uniref:hypothetical protein n=1 Tax=Bacteroides faecichinchillae TaxID=871325 RepID=UPI001A7EB829